MGAGGWAGTIQTKERSKKWPKRKDNLSMNKWQLN